MFRRLPRVRLAFLHPPNLIVQLSKKPRTVKVDVGAEERHGATLGDLVRFVQICAPVPTRKSIWSPMGTFRRVI